MSGSHKVQTSPCSPLSVDSYTQPAVDNTVDNLKAMLQQLLTQCMTMYSCSLVVHTVHLLHWCCERPVCGWWRCGRPYVVWRPWLTPVWATALCVPSPKFRQGETPTANRLNDNCLTWGSLYLTQGIGYQWHILHLQHNITLLHAFVPGSKTDKKYSDSHEPLLTSHQVDDDVETPCHSRGRWMAKVERSFGSCQRQEGGWNWRGCYSRGSKKQEHIFIADKV